MSQVRQLEQPLPRRKLPDRQATELALQPVWHDLQATQETTEDKSMKRDRHQRTAYALRRMSTAVDRGIVTTDPNDKAIAARWASAWARAAGIHPKKLG
jgi:hypothetical protein